MAVFAQQRFVVKIKFVRIKSHSHIVNFRTDVIPSFTDAIQTPFRYKKTPPKKWGFFRVPTWTKLLTLTGFETALRLVNDVYAALTAHDTAVAVTLLQRAE